MSVIVRQVEIGFFVVLCSLYPKMHAMEYIVTLLLLPINQSQRDYHVNGANHYCFVHYEPDWSNSTRIAKQ